MTTTPELRLYTFAQAAHHLHIPEGTARGLFKRRALPLVRIGRRLYVRHQDLVAYLDAQHAPDEGVNTVNDDSQSLRLYSCDDVAEVLNILPRSARELFNRRALPLVTVGRRLYVRHPDLVAYLDAQHIDPAGGDQS